jgi:dihydropyrimidinase
VREGRLSENQFVAVLSTNQARIYGAYPRKGALVPGADADVVLWDPELTTTATAENRHGNVDYTPYEGMTFNGGPASVYVRGNLVYKDGEVVGEHGSGRFIERNFSAPVLGAKV